MSWLKILFQEGHKELPRNKWVYNIFVAFAVAVSVFGLWLGSVGNMNPYYYGVIFLTGTLPLGFITIRATKKAAGPSVIDYICSVLMFAAGLHLLFQMDYLITRISGLDELTLLDKTAAVILVALTVELCRRTLGFGLTSLVVIGIVYVFWGDRLQGTFGHQPISSTRFLEEMVFTTNGIFGDPIQVAATYALLFIMFGHFFQKAGAGQFIFDMCATVMGKRTGGLAKVAVTSAGVFGSISGSPVSDVATTGSINIPMMKKRGYQPVFAGAVESAAATGGTFLPPVMGSVAFLMVQFTGIPYMEIAMASIVTALLFYLGVYFQVHFRSLKLNLVGMSADEIPSFAGTLKAGFYYIIPVVILVWAIHEGYTPSLAACYGILACYLFSFVKRATWIRIKDILWIFTDVIYSLIPLTVATAAAGMIIGIINVTGLAGKFTFLIFSITGSDVFLTLLVSAIILIVLGMGMPTPSVYILAASLIAPALIEVGIPLLNAHMFLLYYAALSAITPPVGVAAFAAAGIAQANPFAIGFQAVRLAFVGFVLPFYFIFNPALLLQGDTVTIVLGIITAIIGVYALSAGYEGFVFADMAIWERVLLVVAGIMVMSVDVIWNVVSLAVIIAILLKNRFQQRRNLTNRSLSN